MSVTPEDAVAGAVMSFDDVPPDVEITDDGGAIVTLSEEEESQPYEFYDNIVEMIPEDVLTTLATDLVDCVTRDKEARKKRDKEYAEAVKRTGLGKEAPGGAEFEGASRAVHPLLTEATVDYASVAIKELMPPDGPVRSYIPGDASDLERLKKADRKKDYMNWQFLEQMPEFRPEIEQLLSQLALSGSQYMRLTPDWSKRKTRACPKFVPQDQVSIPYAASNFYTAERQTYHEEMVKTEFEARIRDNMYRDIAPLVTSQPVKATEAQKAIDKIEGKEPSDFYNKDGVRTVHEINMWVKFEDDDANPDDSPAPYLVSLDDPTHKIVSIVRNWEEDDQDFERMQWTVEFGFIPWRGAYSIGLGQMIGSLSGAATGALRALLDSAHVNNLPTLIRLKGSNFMGQSKELSATEITEIDGGIAGDDIRKLLMAVPFNQPSEVLFSLLGFCVDTGRGMVRTTLENLSENNLNLPVGTTLAMIEEGMKVFSAIHLRSHYSMTQVIKILHRVNKMYLTEDEVRGDLGEVLAYREDFQGPMDIVPTADPQVFSDVQRIAQLQIVQQRADVAPDLYNRRVVEKRLLDRTKIPNPDEFLIPEQKVEPMNQVNENVAMALGRPVAAFPDQDHLAHIEVLLDFIISPTFGQLPIIAPTFLPASMEHLKEHLVLWYVGSNFELLKEATGMDDQGVQVIMSEQDQETKNELDRTLASASSMVLDRSHELFAQIPEIITQVQQLIETFKQPPELPVDPNAMAETQRKTQESAEKIKVEIQKLSESREIEFAKLSSGQREVALKLAQEAAERAAERASRLELLMLREQADDERTAATLGSVERRNTQDNLTALNIAAAEIASGDDTDLSTGTGINP